MIFDGDTHKQCSKCKEVKRLTYLIKHHKKCRGASREYSCRNKKSCSNNLIIQCSFCYRLMKGKYLTRLDRSRYICEAQENQNCTDLRRENRKKIRHSWDAEQIDETIKRYNGYKFNYKNGDIIRLSSSFFNDEKWIARRFSFSRNKIYEIVDDGIFDDNNKFLDFNIQTISEIPFEYGVGTFKIMSPFIWFYLFETECYCRNWKEKTGELGCGKLKPITEYYYNKSIHGQCLSCFELRKNEKRKNKLFMAFINNKRSAINE